MAKKGKLKRPSKIPKQRAPPSQVLMPRFDTPQTLVNAPIYQKRQFNFFRRTKGEVEKASQVSLSQGTHPQPWRTGRAASGGPIGAGARLGSTRFLANQFIIVVQLNINVFIEYQEIIRISTRQRPTEQQILGLIKSNVYDNLKTMMFDDISHLVPSDSGRLRNAMELSITHHSIYTSLNPFYVVLNTGRVPYAGPVNKMPNEWLKHSHGPHQKVTYGGHINSRSSRTGRKVKKAHYLNDPDAEKGWFEKVRDKGRIYAKNLWNTFLSNYLAPILFPVALAYKKAGIKLNAYNLGKSLFSVRYQ